ncbi:unnamed protein product [Caenorhabditis sp. 36 PRJEB53466]|nr:unnamed protein product [Caenorhabditis sp. 36 PRJEB53466]
MAPGPMPPTPKPKGPMPPIVVPPISIPPAVAPTSLSIAAGGPVDLYESQHKDANDACIKRLRQLNVEDGRRVYPAPSAPGQSGKTVEVQTNIFGIEVTKQTELFHYVVHAKADLASNKEAVFTKKGKEDYVVLDRNEKCCDILFHAIETHPDLFKMPHGNHIVYDGQSVLFTTIDIFEGFTGPTKTHIIEINGADTKNADLAALTHIKLEIFPGKCGKMAISGPILAERTADGNLEVNNRSYSQFLEIALNQKCIRETENFGCFEHGKVYFLKPTNQGFRPADCIDVGDGKALFPGVKKTVQFIEGPFGRGQNNPSVVIDAMKAAFHKEQPVLNKIHDILRKDPSAGLSDADRDRVGAVIKGLDIFSNYTGRTRHLKIEGIHHDSPAKARFELKEGGSVTVQQYFQDKYNIALKYPNSNLLICKERGNKNYYPAELMTITKSQRVTIPQQTSVQSQKTTKECAVLPDVRQHLIVQGKNATNICEENELLKELGVKVYPQPLMAKAREFESKELQYATRTSRSELGKWRSPQDNYINPCHFPQVWAAYAIGTSSSQFSPGDMQGFIQQFVECCQRKGITVGPPAEYPLVTPDKIDEKLQFAIRSKCKFVFVITDDSITHLHQRFKFLERNSEMIIQDMKMSKAISVVRAGKRLTLENVINKTNLKLGGANYTVVDHKKSMSDEQLIIGVGVSAPPPGTKYLVEGKGYLNPLIVGFGSNAKASQEFSGDFVLAPNGQETMASIEDVVRNSLDLYRKSRNNSVPKRIIIYRSGASEGSHGAILAYEIPLAREVIRDIAPDAKLIYIVVTKDHSYRFFQEHINPGLKPTEMNIPAGIVLDHAVTHPACKQFFLNSHTTLQGSAKSPLYTVLYDDCNASMDRLEELTYTLCFHHQIVSLTTSLPTPLYIGNEYAKRGRALWNEKTQGLPVEINGSERARLEEFTKEIAYKFTEDLYNKRVNA